MLMGEFHHSIDAKGRLIIPAKFRADLGSDFVLTRGMDGCLFGYPMSQWQKLQTQIEALPLTKKDARTFSRFLYSAATECELDKQGRVNIPKPLSQHAGLDKACVLVASPTASKSGARNGGPASPPAPRTASMIFPKI